MSLLQVPHEEVHSYGGKHLKGETAAPPQEHHLQKRSLEHLLNKLDYKAKKLELKRQKLIKHYALKGYFLHGKLSHFKYNITFVGIMI